MYTCTNCKKETEEKDKHLTACSFKGRKFFTYTCVEAKHEMVSIPIPGFVNDSIIMSIASKAFHIRKEIALQGIKDGSIFTEIENTTLHIIRVVN